MRTLVSSLGFYSLPFKMGVRGDMRPEGVLRGRKKVRAEERDKEWFKMWKREL